MQIFILDDSKIQRRIIINLIRELGFTQEIVEAENGKDGLEKIDKLGKDIGVILCDWNMPVLNGADFLREMATIPKLATIPVVMVTTEGTSRAFEEVKSICSNLAGYVVKPFTSKELGAAISPILRLKS